MRVDHFKLLSLLLRNVQPDRQIVVILDESFNCASSILQILTQRFSLFGQLLDHIRYFDSIQGRLSQLFIFTQQVPIDALQFAYVFFQSTQHAICALQLLNQGHALPVCSNSLPPLHGSPHRFEVVVLHEGHGQFLGA